MSKAVDLSAIVTAISIAAASMSAVLYFKDDQSRQDKAHAPQAAVVELRQEQTASDLDTRYWRSSEYKKAIREGRCDEGCRARYEMIEKDITSLTRKHDALQKEKELLAD